MKNSLLLLIIIATFAAFFFLLVWPRQNSQNLQNISPTPILSSPVPKTFKFDSSTDLKAELESINPQILESDF